MPKATAAIEQGETFDRAAPARKINLMILTTSLWIGGAETVIRHLAEAIDRRRFNLTVCHLKHRGSVGDELVNAGVEVIGVAEVRDDKVDYFTWLKLLKVIKERQIDVIHTHTTHALVDAAICKVLRPRLKVVNTFHFGNYPHTKSRIMWMERIFSPILTRLYAVGEVQRAQLRNVYGFDERRIGVIWNGVTPPGKGDPSFRSRVGADGRVLVGTIATLIKQKGLKDLMHVARKVVDAGHNVQFVIVGEGHMRPELEALRRELNLDDRVVLTGWVTSAAAVALPTFDVFFQPSLWEAMSVVILEAMAAGKAIVATKVGETPHIIEDGVNGLLANPTDIDGMAAALGKVIGDKQLRDRIGAAAAKKVEQAFTVDHMTRAYEQVYTDVVR